MEVDFFLETSLYIVKFVAGDFLLRSLYMNIYRNVHPYFGYSCSVLNMLNIFISFLNTHIASYDSDLRCL